jgi:hypothetical protein
LLETIRTERFSQLIVDWIEKQEVRIVAVARHFSLVNAKLFGVDLMDLLVEITAPTKD